ncbi:MAG: hypothetical protein JO129_03750 [Candidatus Dependentiae bacterium]|nr:hypothetical protein [Candidatus Dependentiae bacterium]
MKFRFIFYSFIFYSSLIQSDQGPNPINIIVNAQTQSGVQQENNNKQNADQTCSSEVNASRNADKENEKPQQLKKVQSDSRHVALGMIRLAGVQALVASGSVVLFPVYMANRFLLYPILFNGGIWETIPEEEVAELAKEGKKRIPEMIVFPVIFHTRKFIENYAKKHFSQKKE